MKKNARVRFFSIKRLALSIVLGFLLPLGYAVMLSVTADVTGRIPMDFTVMPIGWPRPLWILLIGRQPSDRDLVAGIAFMTVANIALYGTMVYSALLALALVRRQSLVLEPPPAPERFHSRATTSD
ncbi:MAG: hypothetical protein ABJC10_03665 [Acidobacteriota bacterium]